MKACGPFPLVQVVEVGFVICFMFFNILVSAYIIGTITLVVVSQWGSRGAACFTWMMP